MLFEDTLKEDFGVMTDNIWLSLSVQLDDLAGGGIFDLVCGEKDTLAKEVGQNVVSRDKLHSPVKSVENVSFLGYKLLIREGHSDVLDQLLYTWVGHLMVFRGDKDAGSRNQSHDLLLRFASEVGDAEDVLADVCELHVRVKSCDRVVESLLLVLKLTAKLVHAVDVEFTSSHVERSWIEALSKSLALIETLKDQIHGYLSFEGLISCSDSLYEILTQSILGITTSISLLNSSLILKGTTGRAVSIISLLFIPQKVGLWLTCSALGTLERKLVSLRLACSAVFGLQGHIDKFFLSGLFWRGSQREGGR